MRVVVVLMVLVAAVLTGCTASPESAPIIAPGTPGGVAQTLSPGEASGVVPVPPNAADLKYVAMMIGHHEQALAMTRFAPERAGNATVKGLAERIRFSQEPEIGAMRQWLRSKGQLGSQSGDHGAMPGMATQEQLTALGAARGREFDRMFLELMIKHHEGAIKMAEEVLGAGADVQVEEMANDVVATQSDEINRMKALLPTL